MRHGGLEARPTVVAAGGGGQPCGVFSRGCSGGDGGAGVAAEHGCGGIGRVKPIIRRAGRDGGQDCPPYAYKHYRK